MTASKSSKRSITAAKRKEKEKKERQKKVHKLKSLKMKVTFSSQNFDFSTHPSQNVVKRNASGKKGKLSYRKCLFE